MTMMAVSSEDLEQFTVPYNVLEGILLNDFDSFLIIYKDWRKQTRQLTKEKMCQCDDTIESFENTDLPGIIIKESGEI